MCTIRGVKDRRFKFTQIINSMFEDPKLSLKAKGFIGYCLTKTEDWIFHIDALRSALDLGKDAIYSVINECLEKGYAYRYQPRDEKGRLLVAEFIISDSKEEIDSRKREHEASPDFKKCLPNRENTDTDKTDTVNSEPVVSREVPGENSAIYSNTDYSNTKEQQQHRAAVFSKTSQEKQPSNEVYPILKDIDIPLSDKEEISRRYKPLEIEHAIKWATHPSTKINNSLAAAIKWACQHQPTIPVEKVNLEAANKCYAMRYDTKRMGKTVITALNNSVEFYWGGEKGIRVIKYDEPGFMDQFKNELRKHGYEIYEIY